MNKVFPFSVGEIVWLTWLETIGGEVKNRSLEKATTHTVSIRGDIVYLVSMVRPAIKFWYHSGAGLQTRIFSDEKRVVFEYYTGVWITANTPGGEKGNVLFPFTIRKWLWRQLVSCDVIVCVFMHDFLGMLQASWWSPALIDLLREMGLMRNKTMVAALLFCGGE